MAIMKSKSHYRKSHYLNLRHGPPLMATTAAVIVVGSFPAHAANQRPNAQFTAEPMSGTAPLEVKLDASKSSDPDNKIVSYEWSTSDQSSAGRKANMTLTDPGKHDIQLVVLDELGSADTVHKTVIVLEPVPEAKANFTVTPDSGAAPLTVTVNASKSTGNIVDYEWSTSNGLTVYGRRATFTFEDAGSYTIKLTVTTSEDKTATVESAIVVSPAPEVEGPTDPDPGEVEGPTDPDPGEVISPAPSTFIYNSTARVRPQVVAAGVTPSKLDLGDDHFDITALVRPGATPIRRVSFQDTDGPLKMGMTRVGVLENGDELHKLTFYYDSGSITGTFSTAWGSKPGQYNIVATDEANQHSHTYPYLQIGNFPALSPDFIAAREPTLTMSYNTTVRAAPQVVMAGYVPVLVHFADNEFDVIAVVRPGVLPIKAVVLKTNEGQFAQEMTLAAEVGNGDKVYKFTYTFEPGSLGTPGEGSVISYKDLWGPESTQFGIEVVDDGEQRNHKFPNLEFGNYPALKR
jgi:PKD repeat protein